MEFYVLQDNRYGSAFRENVTQPNRVQDSDTAYERLLKGEVKYRFVIDMASLKD